MLSFPLKFPRKRSGRRSRRGPTAPPPPPPPQVNVVAVTIASPNELDFSFSRDVTCDGTYTDAIVVYGTNAGDVSPIASQFVTANIVRFEFEAAVSFAGGEAWEILSAPACLDLQGATMPVPQGGVVA